MALRNNNIIEDEIDLAIKTGVARAIAEHKRAGRSIAISRNGKVVIVPAEKIRVTTETQRHKEK